MIFPDERSSPAWPFSYRELEPWYAKAEWLYQVRGLHGEDPSEGPWSEEYPWPPVTHEPMIQRIADDLDRAGAVHAEGVRGGRDRHHGFGLDGGLVRVVGRRLLCRPVPGCPAM